jgi:type II secretory pathway component PulL
VRRVAVLFIAAVLSFACVTPVHARHKSNPEGRAAQQRAKQLQKEGNRLAKSRQKENKRLKASRYTADR